MKGVHLVPDATYRLQLGRHCTFASASGLLPYLAALGVSHLYCSPYLRARRGSPHGYDITDHNAFQPEIGDEAGFRRFVEALRSHGMGHILDLVSNHMGVGGDDNAWWLDVLENGAAAAHADYFDIDWHAVLNRLRGRVLLPVLGDHYGAVLARGEIRLVFLAEKGELRIRYGPHAFPLDPRTYPGVLGTSAQRAAGAGAASGLDELAGAFAALPARDDGRPSARRQRRLEVPLLKRRLAVLCGRLPGALSAVRAAVKGLNGAIGDERSFDVLHRLLEAQAFRLAHWRVAADEINYRRFFDINELAGLRMEGRRVFVDVHRLVRRLAEDGDLDGLRIDHVDGLYDPGDYARRVRSFFAGYLVVEKILTGEEQLPQEWPVHGTTGYDFARLVDGLFVDPAGERSLTRLCQRYTGAAPDFDELLHACKRLVIRSQLSGELTMLANMADAIAQADRHTRDFTLNGLRDALAELVAWFPVYRTYVGRETPSEQDRRHLARAVAQARHRAPAEEAAVYRFLWQLLLLEAPALARNGRRRAQALRFVRRFQQYTGPVMAKALEDTALYRYHRLTALNEVGGDPRHFGVSVAEFHEANRRRRQRHPHCMLAGSTHDSKRSEDIRARLLVLSELPEAWRRRVFRWSRLTRRYRGESAGVRVPSRNDEYLFYQTLLGAWPPGVDVAPAAFTGRMVAYMHKAAREAKQETSWINPDAGYEDGLERFVRGVLRPTPRNAFVADFLVFQRRVARLGALNALARTLLRLTAPGVPDIYQGDELWRFDLVDPDNRGEVDFPRRRRLLAELRSAWSSPDADVRVGRTLADPTDDRAKLLLTWRALAWRRSRPALFRDGDYRPLSVIGAAAHVCGFARAHREDWAATAVLRWAARLPGGEGLSLPDREAWGETWVSIPVAGDRGHCFDALTGRQIPLGRGPDGARAHAADLFGLLPAVLLVPRDPRPVL